MMKYYVSDSARDTIESITYWIKDNLSEPMKIRFIAEKSGYSAYYFQRCFKIVTGLTPAQYIRHERMQKAKKLLERTDMPLTQIAIELGYSQQSIFCRIFKEYYTITPKEFRRNKNQHKEVFKL